MAGRHRRVKRRSWWFPVVGVVTGVTLGSATYGSIMLSSAPVAEPRLPSGEPAAQPGQFDRTATVTGVVDGDSFTIDGGATVRVLAADSCEGNTDAGPAGRADAQRVLAGATVALRREPTGKHDVDQDGRLLRYVEVPGIGDLGAFMVQRPHTGVYTGFNDASAAYLDQLRALDRDGRRCMDDLPAATARPAVDYRDCAAATAAGAAPLYAGDRGYRRDLDGNDDGVACE